MTGDPKRKIRLHLFSRVPENPQVALAFDNLHFPACGTCNSGWSLLEELVKPIVESMFSAKPLSANQINLFLDWLDKVRIGLWLAFIYLEKNIWDIHPNFHIMTRTRGADRMVIIARANDLRRGINFAAVNTPFFHHSPTCFELILNNLYFLNISTDFLLARRIGFPYPSESVVHKDGKVEYSSKGGEKES